MNRMPLAKRAQILGFLVEGMSLRAASRLADCSLNTVMKLLADVGVACSEYQDQALRNLPCKRIQCDEIWSFVGSKNKNAGELAGSGERGDVWTWTALDPDTKLIASWMVGRRDGETGEIFIKDLASRLANRIQLTTDGLRVYIDAVHEGFNTPVDFAMLVKHYAEGQGKGSDRRYSPSQFISAKKRKIMGKPDMAKASTSHVERQNLTMRMGMRRFTRLTNAFSKKVENHAHAVALHFMYYNFGRIHKTLRITPAMEAGIASHVWSLAEIAALVPEPVAKKRGPYKKKI
jgi:IS1 family transposase